MKQELSPGVIAAVLAVVVILLGAIFWFTARPGKQAAEIEKAIENSAVKAPSAGGMPGPGAGAPTPGPSKP